MSNLAFIASVVGSLAVPTMVVVILAIFRRPLTELISRVISYEGMGQKVTFGKKLADAEESVGKAVAEARQKVADTEKAVGDVEYLRSYGVYAGLLAEALIAPEKPVTSSGERKTWTPETRNMTLPFAATPSFIIVSAWNVVVGSILRFRDLSPAATANPILALYELDAKGRIAPSLVYAASNLHDLRNRVVVEGYEPTPGEAVVYFESARRLAGVLNAAWENWEPERAKDDAS